MQNSSTSKQFKWSQIRELALDPKAYLFATLTLLSNIPNYVYSTYGPVLLNGIAGLDKRTTLLLNCGFGFLQIVCILGTSWLAYRFRIKSVFYALLYVPIIVRPSSSLLCAEHELILLLPTSSASRSSTPFRKPGPTSARSSLASTSTPSPSARTVRPSLTGSSCTSRLTQSLLVQLSSSAGSAPTSLGRPRRPASCPSTWPPPRRATSSLVRRSPFLLLAAARRSRRSVLLAANLFRANDAPLYKRALMMNMILAAITLLNVGALVVVLWFQNKQKERQRVANGKPAKVRPLLSCFFLTSPDWH